jgi:hypothetical protein
MTVQSVNPTNRSVARREFPIAQFRRSSRNTLKTHFFQAAPFARCRGSGGVLPLNPKVMANPSDLI